MAGQVTSSITETLKGAHQQRLQPAATVQFASVLMSNPGGADNTEAETKEDNRDEIVRLLQRLDREDTQTKITALEDFNFHYFRCC